MKSKREKAGVKVSDQIGTTTPASVSSIEAKEQTKKMLDDLLARITRKNLHQELDWGRPVTPEVWQVTIRTGASPLSTRASAHEISGNTQPFRPAYNIFRNLPNYRHFWDS